VGGDGEREVGSRVREVRKGFQEVRYCFRDTPAYSFR